MQSDGVALILRETDVCHYVEVDAISPLWRGQRFPMGSCISGWTMANRETAVIPDIYKDNRVSHDLYRPTFVRSMVVVPVSSPDPVGAIGAYWAHVRDPRNDEVEFLEILAKAASSAIENIRLVATLSHALKDAEHARDELRHRVKNAFAAAQSLASLTLPKEHASGLSARLVAMAKAHALLDRRLQDGDTVDLYDLMTVELAPYRADDTQRVEMVGSRLRLPAAMSIAIGLAVNELATNALKHGALSVPNGRVRVWWRHDRDHLFLDWRESDGPNVRAAAVESFGSRLLRRLVEGQLSGTITRDLAESGVTCVIEVPLPGGGSA